MSIPNAMGTGKNTLVAMYSVPHSTYFTHFKMIVLKFRDVKHFNDITSKSISKIKIQIQHIPKAMVLRTHFL